MSKVKKSITVEAEDPKAGMTLAELAAVVSEAMGDDASTNGTVKASLTWGGKLKSLTIVVER